MNTDGARALQTPPKAAPPSDRHGQGACRGGLSIGNRHVRAGRWSRATPLHTFHFVSPAKTDADKIPNACNVCHTDKPTSWTADALKSWAGDSPWRMAE